MRILLAPMEGVLDLLARELLIEVNSYDLCITEFVRVVNQLLPTKVFHRLCPELHNNSQTPSGTLVHIQLLGRYPQWLAENAARAVELGSYGVDLDCGYLLKLVDGSGGGATLLKDPELVYRGAKAIRGMVPAHLPVTVKIRPGWDNSDRQFEITDAVQQAGASELAVYGRAKGQGYKAGRINWQAIGEIRQRLTIPVIANGEIWNWQSAQDYMAISGCDAVMIERDALNIPNLSRVVKYNGSRIPWPGVMTLLRKCTRLEKQGDIGSYHVVRVEQWLGYLRKEYSEATKLFQEIRALDNLPDIAQVTRAIEITT